MSTADVLSLEVILEFMSLTPLAVWNMLLKHQPRLGLLGTCRFSGTLCTIAEIPSAIEKSGKSHFHIEVGGGRIHYSHVRNFSQSLLQVEQIVSNLDDAWRWLGPFLPFIGLTQARLSSGEYEYWQNAEDPLLYQKEGRAYGHLPTKSNGLPPPLERRIIDISNNPGRRVLRDGYVEAVAAFMWLGSAFWKVAPADKPSVLACEWLEAHDHDNYTFLKAADRVFASADGECGQRQDQLRRLLFGR